MKAAKKIVFVGIMVAVAILARSARAATLSFVSGTSSSSIGGTIDVSVRIDSQGQTVNAAQGTMLYPNNLLQVVSVNNSNSIFNIWAPQPSVNTSTGEISFLGGSTNSYSGSSLYVLDVTFIARAAGVATLNFSNAGVTAGDGTGANILSSSTPISFTIGGSGAVPASGTSTQAILPALVQIKRAAIPTSTVPVAPVLTISLYPDQNAWYNTIADFLVQWQLPADVTDVATALNQDPQFNPIVSGGLFNNQTFGALSEGIWYLHVRFKNSVGWGPTIHYRIAIDTTPPLPFTAAIKEGSVTEITAPTVQFSTEDQPSGLAFYQIFADGNMVGSTTNASFTLPSLSFGAHDIVVQAVDSAGNITESRTSVTISPPPFLTVGDIKITEEIFFGTIIAVIIIGVLIGWWLGRKAKSQRKNRIIIAGRDVTTAFGVIQKNIDKLLGLYGDGSVGVSQGEDIAFLLKETKEQTEKMKRYVSENVEEIE